MASSVQAKTVDRLSDDASVEEPVESADESPDLEASPPPRTAGVLQLGAGFRYGVAVDDPGVDPWRTGLGVSLGYTMYSGLYFGGVFDYFLGETLTFSDTEVSANVWQLSGELGYDVMLGRNVMLRPKMSAGVSTLNVECSGPGCPPDASETYLGVAPGATLVFYLGRVTLGLDARYQVVFADPETAEAVILSAGIGF